MYKSLTDRAAHRAAKPAKQQQSSSPSTKQARTLSLLNLACDVTKQLLIENAQLSRAGRYLRGSTSTKHSGPRY